MVDHFPNFATLAVGLLDPGGIFVGRGRDLNRFNRQIDDERHRLITVTGAAGVGKTRLALEALAERHPVVVPLASQTDPSQIIPQIARSLGIVDQTEHLDTKVADLLASRPIILLLDNFEQLVPSGTPVIAGILAESPLTTVVLTSRQPTGLPDESLIELKPFPGSGVLDDEKLANSPGVQMFIDRASKRNPFFKPGEGDLARINDLCVRYDGLPLAIELLASQTDVLSLDELINRDRSLVERRGSHRNGAHASLFAAIDSSYQLLTPELQALFRRLAIFTAGFSKDFVVRMAAGRTSGSGYPWADGYDVEWPFDRHGLGNPTVPPFDDQDPAISKAIASLDLDPVRALGHLIDARLIHSRGTIDRLPVFGMLESIREFGLEQLRQSGELEATLHARAAVMIAFAEASSETLWNSQADLWGRERIDDALPDIRATLQWANDLGLQGGEIMLRIAGPLWPYWQTRGLVTEGRSWLELALAKPDAPLWCRDKEMPALAFLCWIQNDDQRAEAVAKESLEVTRLTGVTNTEGTANFVLALLEFHKGLDHVFQMMAYVEEAERLFRHWGDPIGIGSCAAINGIVCRLTGQTDTAFEQFAEATRFFEEAGYAWGLAVTRYFTGETLRDMATDEPEQLPEAVQALDDSLDMYWNQGDHWGAGGSMSGLACALVQSGEPVLAAQYFGASAALMTRVGASLLPTELMTHEDTSRQLRERLGHAIYDAAFKAGFIDPDQTVHLAMQRQVGERRRDPRLTRAQLHFVRQMRKGDSVRELALRTGKSKSSTYDMLERIEEELGVHGFDAVIAECIKLKLLDDLAVGSPSR